MLMHSAVSLSYCCHYHAHTWDTVQQLAFDIPVDDILCQHRLLALYSASRQLLH